MSEADRIEKVGRVAEMIVKAKSVVVFTGAGVSTESGIPDFRSPGGLWTKFDPDEFTIDKFMTSRETRRKQWRFLLSGDVLTEARPNAAHLAIADLERLGKLGCVITQNIDNLHQKAGNDPAKVFELHGNMRWIVCTECGERYPLDEILRANDVSEEAPVCGRCSGILKPDVVFFGEVLPESALGKATWHARNCDLMLVIGSSLVVYPAAYMPVYASEAGASLVIVNLTPTSLDRSADVVIKASAGETMEAILSEVKRRMVG